MVNYNNLKEIPDWEFITQTVANAYFSGLCFDELWNAVIITDNREDFDVAVDAAIKLNKMVKGNIE